MNGQLDLYSSFDALGVAANSAKIAFDDFLTFAPNVPAHRKPRSRKRPNGTTPGGKYGRGRTRRVFTGWNSPGMCGSCGGTGQVYNPATGGFSGRCYCQDYEEQDHERWYVSINGKLIGRP